jgi:multidrug efflux pump subunit AcrB
VERTEEVTQQLEKIVQDQLAPMRSGGKETPLYTTVLSDTGLPIGRTAIFSTNTGTHSANLQVNLVPRMERPMSDVVAAEKVRAALKDAVPGTQVFFFIGGIVKRIQNFGAAAPIDVEVLGYDFEAGSKYGNELMAKMRLLTDAKGRPIVVDVQSSREENSPEFDVIVDREKAGMLGISEQDVAQTILVSLLGNTQITPVPYTDPKTGNEYYINVRMDDNSRGHVGILGDLFVRTPANGIVNVDTLATSSALSGPVMIDRKYLQRIVHVTANIAPDRILAAASEAVQNRGRSDCSRRMDSPPPWAGRPWSKEGLPGPDFRRHHGAAARLHGAGQPVQVAHRSAGHHVQRAAWRVGRVHHALPHRHQAQREQLHGHHHDGRHRGVERRASGRLRQRAEAAGQELREATIEAGRTRLRPILMTTIATSSDLSPWPWVSARAARPTCRSPVRLSAV